MGLDGLYKIIARVVLVSYTTTNLLAPLAHACDMSETNTSETRSTRSGSFNLSTTSETNYDYAEDYQYRLSVKTLDAKTEHFQLKLVRKEKGSTGKFENLHTVTINKGNLTPTSSTENKVQDDTLLKLFKSAKTYHFIEENNTTCFMWDVANFGTLKLDRGGSVFFDQGSPPLFLAYDLILKTSGDLFLQSLGVSELTLQSPQTTIIGALATNHLHMDHNVINEGGLQTKQLTGQGTFTNHAVLKLDGTSDQPAILGVHRLINKKGNSGSKEAKIESTHLNITSDNQSLINEEDAEISVEDTLLVDSAISSSFINKGVLRLHNATLNREASNDGSWQAHQMIVEQGAFTNKDFGTLNILDQLIVTSNLINENEGDITVKNLLKLEKGVNKGSIKVKNVMVAGEFVSSPGSKLNTDTLELYGGGKFTNSLRSVLTIHKELNADDALLQNDGELVSQGKFVQQTGEFNNAGRWDHQGDIELGSTKLSNKGEMVWQNGKWAFTPTRYDNFGSWTLDQIKCSQQFTVHNHGMLHLKNGAITFQHIINHKNLIFSAGQYILMGGLQNNHMMRFLEHDWAFTDDFSNTAANRLVLKDNAIKGYTSAGEIEVEKALTYDVQPLPKLIRSNGKIVFSPRHHKTRNLSDLEKVITPGKVSFYTPAITTTKDYEFANIGHLELMVDGFFQNPYEFKTPILTLDVNGPIVGGTSNEMMGKIASTKGGLKVRAHTFDGRFAKVYGTGPTVLETTRGDVLVGSETKGVWPKELYGGYIGWDTNTLWDVQNGAYVASGNTLEIISPTQILADYGQLVSVSDQRLKAGSLVRNTAGWIASLGALYLDTPEYMHTRGGIIFRTMDDGRRMNANYKRQCPASDAALLEALGDILLNVDQITNVASDIRSGGHVINKGNVVKEGVSPYYHEERYNLSGFAHGYNFQPNHWVYTPTLHAAKSIQFFTGGFAITGNLNAPSIVLKGTGSGLFDNTSRRREFVDVTKGRITNLNNFIASEAPNLSPETKMLFGKSYEPDTKNMVMLANSKGQIPHSINLASPCIINPLASLNLNLFIQRALSKVAGKVWIKGGSGNDLERILWGRNSELRQQTGKETITEDELQNITSEMLLYGLEQIEDITHLQTFLCLPPASINPYQSSGDISGDKITIKTTGNQTHLNNRIVARDRLNAISTKESVTQETQEYTVHYGIENGSITQEVAMPQQQFICKKGDVNVSAYKDVTSVGALTRAGRDIGKTAKTGDIKTEDLTLARTMNLTTKKTNWYGSSKTTSETSTSHTILPSTTVAGRNIIESAGKGIYLTGAHEEARDTLGYRAPLLDVNAAIAVNTHSFSSSYSNAFRSKESSSFNESMTSTLTKMRGGKQIIFDVDEVNIKGTHIQTPYVLDSSQNMTLGMNVQNLQHYATSSQSSVVGYADCDRRGGCLVGIPTFLDVDTWVSLRGRDTARPSTFVYDSAQTLRPMKLFDCRKDFIARATPLRQWETVSMSSGGFSSPAVDFVTTGALPFGNSYKDLGKGDAQDQAVAILKSVNETVRLANDTIKLMSGDPSGFLSHFTTVTFGTQTYESSFNQTHEQAPILNAHTGIWQNSKTHLKGHYQLDDATILTDDFSASPMVHTQKAHEHQESKSCSVGFSQGVLSVSGTYGSSKGSESHKVVENSTLKANNLFIAANNADLTGLKVNAETASIHIKNSASIKSEADDHRTKSSSVNIGISTTGLGDCGFSNESSHKVKVSDRSGISAKQLYMNVGGQLYTLSADYGITPGATPLVLSDHTERYLNRMPAIDNACGFFGLLWGQPNVDLSDPRQSGVMKLLEGLKNIEIKDRLCDLIAPEIKDWGLVDSDELEEFPQANTVIPQMRQAQDDLTQATQEANEALGLEAGLIAEELLEISSHSTLSDLELTGILDPLHKAFKTFETLYAEYEAWASHPDVVQAYIQRIVGSPGWMLAYGSEHEASPGTMDALALALGLNLHIYKDKDGQITLVHAHQTALNAPLVELLHTAYSPEESLIENHFDRLEKSPIDVKAKSVVVDHIQEIDESSKFKILMPFGTIKSLRDNLNEFGQLTSQWGKSQLPNEDYTPEEVEKVVHEVNEIAAEMAEADKEMAEAEIRAHKKIEARRQIKQGVQKTISKENDHQHYLLESSGVSSNLTETSLTAHSPNDYQDILFELARDKQQISVKHKEALESRSWHEGTRAMVVAAGEILVRDWVDGFKHYANLDYLNMASYLPLVGIPATVACEGREVYTGTKTKGEATFDLVVAASVGKAIQIGGKAVIQGAKAIAKPLVEKSKGALATFTDYVSVKMGGRANTNVPQKLHFDYSNPESAFSLPIDTITGRGPMHVDSRQFTKAESLTSKGESRNAEQFWNIWNKKYPGTVSADNCKLMHSKSHFTSPRVDEQWVSHFPEHKNYLGDVLIHHHIDHGNLVTALPESVHSLNPGRGYFHQNMGGNKK